MAAVVRDCARGDKMRSEREKRSLAQVLSPSGLRRPLTPTNVPDLFIYAVRMVPRLLYLWDSSEN